MSSRLQMVIGCVVVVAIIGCERKSLPPPADTPQRPAAARLVDTPKKEVAEPPADTAKESTSAAPEPMAVPAAAVPPSESTKPPIDSTTVSEQTESLPQKPDQANVEPSPAPTPERIAILTPGGPLLVDVHITINGEPLAKFYGSLVKRVLDAGDSDHDGRSTWKELAADRKYLEKEMPKAPAADSRQMKTLIERYDENRDGKIQPNEAAAWIGRDAGSSAKPLAVRSTRAYRPVPRATSQVWHLIDDDGNGRLTREEIAGASNRLLALDADDDRILAPAEMASLREQLEASGQQRTYVPREANHYAVLHLEPDRDVNRLQYLLSDLYAPQQDLGPDSFSELSEVFKKVDANGDGSFDGEELASLRSVELHMQLNVAFQGPANDKGGAATLDVKTLTPEVAIAAQPSADRTVIALGNTRLLLSAHNLATKPGTEQNAGQATARNQVRLMVHDQGDALFEELDANADGRLGEREIAFCSQRLAERDRNGDGLLAGDEFPYSMIVAFLLGEQASERSFYVPPSAAVSTASSDKPLPTWFSHADLNGDGDVSRREFVGSVEQFERMDSDKDGYIGTAEAAM